MSKRDARRLAENVVKGRLGRDLSEEEYDRLGDAIIDLRTAARALRTAGDATPEQAEQRQALQRALAEIQTITGLAPGEMSAALSDDRER